MAKWSDAQKKNIGNTIRRIRQSRFCNLKEFGLDVTPPTSASIVSRWERGKSLPNNERLKSIAELTGQDIDWINIANEKANTNMNETYSINANKKQPHIRIEFDDITEVPDVFIDGVQVIGSDCKKSVLSKLYINWNTNTDREMTKQFVMETLSSKGVYNEVKQGNGVTNHAKSKTM